MFYRSKVEKTVCLASLQSLQLVGEGKHIYLGKYSP